MAATHANVATPFIFNGIFYYLTGLMGLVRSLWCLLSLPSSLNQEIKKIKENVFPSLPPQISHNRILNSVFWG